MKERIIGLVLLICGLGCGYFGLYAPLDDAAGHKSSTSLSMKAALFCPFCLIFGLIYLILGAKAREILGSREAPTPMVWILGAVSLVAGFGVYWWIHSYLESMGYHFTFL